MPHQSTLSLSAFHEKAKELLEEYITRKYVSADEEREYLKTFAHVGKVLKKTFGNRVICTVMLTADILLFRTLPDRLRLYRGYYEPEKREGISWSLSRKVAEGFAYSLWNYNKETPPVVTGTACAVTCSPTRTIEVNRSSSLTRTTCVPFATSRCERSHHSLSARSRLRSY